MMSWVKDWELYRPLAFAPRKDGALNESRSVFGNADPNLINLSVTLGVLVAVDSRKMAIEYSADRFANSLNFIMLAIWNYSCNNTHLASVTKYTPASTGNPWKRSLPEKVQKIIYNRNTECIYPHSQGQQ